ncbi:hypothetical protein HDV06_002263 [Boothiomyces sp. JEL0866]|nr:hypothetical protein HDV06_002263 [Boothiomyces sp. JEL0866]
MQDSKLERNCMDAHAELLHLEADFQTTLHRWQDDQSVDLSHIINLKAPLDNLIDLFHSFHIPKQNSPDMPSFHVETTLAILQSLLSRYDATLDALTQARESVARLDSRHIVSNQRLIDWASATLKSMSDVRTILLNQHHLISHQQAERELLKQRLAKTEKQRQTSENLALSLAKKLNSAEETVMLMVQEKRKQEQKILSLQTQMKQITNWKEHVKGLGVNKAQPQVSNKRDRMMEYAQKQQVRRILKNEYETMLKSKSNSQTPSRTPNKTPSRTPSRTPTRSRSSSNIKQKKKKVKPDEELLIKLLENLQMERKEKKNMYPAQSILFSKLQQVDGEINQLAKELLLE